MASPSFLFARWSLDSIFLVAEEVRRSRTEQAAALLDESDEKRVRFVKKPHWIEYPCAKRVLGKMEDLLPHPKTHWMPGMLLTSHTNNGKTMIAQRFRWLHPPGDNADKVQHVLAGILTQAAVLPERHQVPR